MWAGFVPESMQDILSATNPTSHPRNIFLLVWSSHQGSAMPVSFPDQFQSKARINEPPPRLNGHQLHRLCHPSVRCAPMARMIQWKERSPTAQQPMTLARLRFGLLIIRPAHFPAGRGCLVDSSACQNPSKTVVISPGWRIGNYSSQIPINSSLHKFGGRFLLVHVGFAGII